MKLNLLPVIVILPFLAACSSSSPSAAGRPSGPPPLDKVQKTSFGSFLKETNKTNAVLSSILTGKESDASDEFGKILRDQLASGKCKLLRDPQQISETEATLEATVSGAECSFEASVFVLLSKDSTTEETTEMKMSLSIKDSELLKKSDIQSQEFTGRVFTSMPDKDTRTNTVTMNGVLSSQSLGEVLVTVEMSNDRDSKGSSAEVRSNYVSKSWNATIVRTSKSGTKQSILLNGEPADLETVRDFNKWVGAIQGS